MNIFHVITGLDDGGAEAVLYRLCCQDTENRHLVVSLMDDGKYGVLMREIGIEVHCLRMPRGRLTLDALWRLWRLLRTKRPDVVQTWMYHADLVGGAVGRLAGVNAICWGIRHTTLERGVSADGTILVARLCARLSGWVPRAIVCCSEGSMKVHQRLGYAARKFFLIQNGYDLGRYAPDEGARAALRAEWRIDDETPLIGMVARYDPQKDHANLVAALAQLREMGLDFVCVMVGTNVDARNAELRDVIGAAGLSHAVRLLGRRDDIPTVMNALDVHVLSSMGEAFPNVIAEAMACGTPCVTTEVGDAALIVGDTGWVVPTRSSGALASAVADALKERRDPIKWRARRQAAREHVARHFDIDRMVNAYRMVWEKARRDLPPETNKQGSWR